jgi:hypothetical protein
MSVDLYYRRLHYRMGRGGMAKEGDVRLELHTAPIVLPEAVEIDFGEVQRGVLAYDPYVRAEGEAKRDMTAPEIIAVRVWLSGLLAGVMRAAGISVPMIDDRRREVR